MAYLITDILTFGDSRPSSPEPSDKPLNIITGVIQLIPPVLSSETLLHILLSSEYSGFRPSTTAVVIICAPISVPTGPTDRR